MNFNTIPFTSPIYKLGEMWLFASVVYNNQKYFGKHRQYLAGLSELNQMLLYDPQTSGG